LIEPPSKTRKCGFVTTGHAVKAMVLNGLGLPCS
jgi:hypothetical protein